MTIEIKGLGATVQRARDAINSARRASTDLETAAGAFATDADAITAEIKKNHDDLLFEAQTLGNSPPPATPLPQAAAAPEVPAIKPTFPAAAVDPGAAA